ESINYCYTVFNHHGYAINGCTTSCCGSGNHRTFQGKMAVDVGQKCRSPRQSLSRKIRVCTHGRLLVETAGTRCHKKWRHLVQESGSLCCVGEHHRQYGHTLE